MLQIDDVVGSYQIVRLIGTGGGSTLYQAYDLQLKRDVVLKFPPPALLGSRRALTHILQEAQLVVQLEHPNIGSVLHIGEHEGWPYIVGRYYKGHDLAQILKKGPLPFKQTLTFIEQSARGLAHAHSHRIVHRDIKPSNLLIAADGQLKILDFGVATTLVPDPLRVEVEHAGVLQGTWAYMAPEVLSGQGADQRVDLWGLGVVFYELLTGVTPFAPKEGDALALLIKNVLTAPLPRLSEIKPFLPPDLNDSDLSRLQAILDGLLAREPHARCGSAEELLDQLKQVDLQKSLAANLAFDTPDIPLAPVPLQHPMSEVPTLPALPLQPLAVARATREELIGRSDELGMITYYLSRPDCTLLTLFGAGGTGKTHLMFTAQTAPELRQAFPDGIYGVVLETVRQPEVLISYVARALGIKLRGNGTPLEELCASLRGRRLLLVLDNVEHLLGQPTATGEDAFIEIVLALLAADIKLLLSSRERLNIMPEWILPVLGLRYPLPIPKQMTTDEVQHYGALALFERQAQRAQPAFTLQDEDALQYTGRICQLVHGVPLAIILAAAWLHHYSVEYIAKRLEEDLDFLRSQSRDLPPRHHSVKAVCDYSWVLLSAEQQRVLSQLSLFHRGATLEAATVITGADELMLSALTDKSLLTYEVMREGQASHHEQGRYHLHPLLKAYARDKLGNEQALKRPYARYYGRLVIDLGTKDPHTLKQLDRELPNISSSWHWLLRLGEYALLREMAPYLREFCILQGRLSEGIILFEQVSALSSSTDFTRLRNPQGQSLSAFSMIALGWMMHHLARHQEAGMWASRGLSVLGEMRDSETQFLGLQLLGYSHLYLGQLDTAKEEFEVLLTQADEAQNIAAVSHAYHGLGKVARASGQLEEARAHLRTALTHLATWPDDQHQVEILHDLTALLYLDLADARAAYPHVGQGLDLSRASGFELMVPYFAALLAVVAERLGQAGKASTALEEAICHVQNNPSHPLYGLVYWSAVELDIARNQSLAKTLTQLKQTDWATQNQEALLWVVQWLKRQLIEDEAWSEVARLIGVLLTLDGMRQGIRYEMRQLRQLLRAYPDMHHVMMATARQGRAQGVRQGLQMAFEALGVG